MARICNVTAVSLTVEHESTFNFRSIRRPKNYRFSQHKAIELNLRFNKVMLFPLKQLLRECLANRDRVPVHIKGLLVSWMVCNENLVRLHQSGRSIRPVSSHYPIRVRCVRVQCGQPGLIFCPLNREEKYRKE